MDNVLYSCDFSAKTRPNHVKNETSVKSIGPSGTVTTEDKNPAVAAVTQIIAKRKKKDKSETGDKSSPVKKLKKEKKASKSKKSGGDIKKEQEDDQSLDSQSTASTANAASNGGSNNGKQNMKVQPPTTLGQVAVKSNISNTSPPLPTMNGRMDPVRDGCTCRASASSLMSGSGIGWEGSAQLKHNSFISMGCIQFVFSIPGHATSSSITAAQQQMQVHSQGYRKT